MILATGARGSMQAVRCGLDRQPGVAARHMDGRQHVGFGGQGRVDRENGRQGLDVEARQPCRAARSVHGGCRHGEHRLASELHDVGRENRIVVLDRPDVVFTRNVGRGDDVDDAGRGKHAGKIESLQASMRHRTHAHGDVQEPARFRQVVGVIGPAGNVQRGGVVRKSDSDHVRARGNAGIDGIERRMRRVH